MRRTSTWRGAAAACVMLALSAGSAVAGERTSTGAARLAKTSAAGQVTYDGPTDVTFALDRAADGAITLQVQRGTLTVTKTVREDGSFVVELRDGSDVVSVGATASAVDVHRSGRRVHLDLSRADDDDFMKARAQLSSSRAVRATRRMAADLGPAALETPEGVGLLLADAFIGYLDGDVGAPSRLARALSDRYGRAHQKVRLAGCYSNWERNVVQAYAEYKDCMASFSVINPIRTLCKFRWTLQVEVAWFEMLSCTAFPWPD